MRAAHFLSAAGLTVWSEKRCSPRLAALRPQAVLAYAALFIGAFFSMGILVRTAAQEINSPPISVNTRLVQVGVVVRDKNGPVADLTKDDFVVFDRGKRRNIAVFSVEGSATVARPVETLAPNTFSDLPQYRADPPRSITIVLLDNLNTLYGSAPGPYESSPFWFEDLALANAKAHLVEYVKQLDPRDRVAIYGLSDSLHVLCDFTGNREQLLEVLKKYDSSSKSNRGAVEPGATHTPVPGSFNSTVDQANLHLAGSVNQRRAEATMAALQAIAAHVANIPGRKNLVWLTAHLPFSGAAIARILSPAQIAAYPVDGRGLLTRASPGGPEGTMDEDAVARGNFMPAQSPQPVGIDTMLEMADETGGQAFVNTNDLTGAIRTAVERSGVTYTLGFYLDSHSADGKFHALRVQTARRGLQIRYPKGYFAYPDAAATKKENEYSLRSAIASPIESSAIPVEVKVLRVDAPMPHALSLLASVDLRALRFVETSEKRKGAIKVVTIEQDETGKILRQSARTVALDFTPEQYAAYSKSGFMIHQIVQQESGAVTLRVIVEDANTAQIGSLIIPLSQLQ